MATFNKFNCFTENLAEKVHDLGADSLKIMLSNTAPSASLTVKGDVTDITAENGYTAGGAVVVVTASTQAAGVYKLVANDLVFTASGGTFGPARYAILYNNTAGAGDSTRPLIAWWDRGASATPAAGETFTIDLDQSGGVLTIT